MSLSGPLSPHRPSLPIAMSPPIVTQRAAQWRWALLVAAGIIATGSHGTLLSLARARGLFSAAAVVCMQELGKLVACVVGLAILPQEKGDVPLTPRDWML